MRGSRGGRGGGGVVNAQPDTAIVVKKIKLYVCCIASFAGKVFIYLIGCVCVVGSGVMVDVLAQRDGRLG